MIFIAVKCPIRPDAADQWLTQVAPFTAATRAEPGNIVFAWSRSVDSLNQFVPLEAFRDRAAGEAHVHAEHFQAAMAWMPDVIAATPEILHVDVPSDGWATMAELHPRTAPRRAPPPACHLPASTSARRGSPHACVARRLSGSPVTACRCEGLCLC